MEGNRMVTFQRNGIVSYSRFGLDKKKEHNGSVFCPIEGIGEQSGTRLN
jgi:hypothetical protein